MSLENLAQKFKIKDWKTTLIGLFVFLIATLMCFFGKISGETWFLSIGVAGLGYCSSDKVT